MIRFLILLAAAIIVTGCSRSARPTESEPVPAKAFATSWQTETQYIVESIATDLAEMSRLAAADAKSGEVVVTTKESETNGLVTYQVTIRAGGQTVECQLPMNAPIWAPRSYNPLMAALGEAFPLSAAPVSDAGPSKLLLTLVTPTVEVIARADTELSELLAKNLGRARHHEEAALLLGVFALREASGKFYQIRGELCRITAHLAMARALAGGAAPGSELGRLAEAMLTVLYNNQTDALVLIEALPDTADYAPWKRALRLRATSDYRSIVGVATPTLLETQEGYRARAGAVSADIAWHELRLDEPQQAFADWTRIAAQEPVSISLGHQILRLGLAAELRECGVAHELSTGRKLEQPDLASALNVRATHFAPAGAPGRIIGWGRWAAFLQRHVCHLVEVDFNFMQKRWGVPEQAAEFRKELDEIFWPLRLYPFVRRFNATDEAYYRTAQDEARAVMMQTPEEVGAEIWNQTCYKVDFCPLYIPPPHAYVNEWHLHNPPPGTAYDPLPRMNQPSLVNRPDAIARLEHLHRMAPYDVTITHNLLRVRDGDRQAPEKMAEAYQEVLDYVPMPSRRIARLSEDDPAVFEKWMRRAIALDPGDLRELARYFEKTGQESKAAETYLEWMAKETDDVAVANRADFVITYLERTGRSAEATALADRAAEAYSYDGLLAKARLLERRGVTHRAYEFYRRTQERYGRADDLLGFLWRTQKTKPTPRFAKELDELMREALPGGLVRFEPGSAPPRLGVVVDTENKAILDAGLRTGDIVVAMRGYRVENWEAYTTIRALDSEPFVLTVWRGKAYRDLAPLPQSYRLGVNLKDYQAP